MTGPRLTLRADRGDLLFYDDVLAVVANRWLDSPDPRAWLVLGLAALLTSGWRGRRRERRRASPETLPSGTRFIRYADVRAVRLERRTIDAAWLVIDEQRFDVRPREHATPWTDLLGPFFGDRLTVV